jgi:hypothetical protein
MTTYRKRLEEAIAQVLSDAGIDALEAGAKLHRALCELADAEARRAYGRGIRDGRKPPQGAHLEQPLNSASALKNGKLRPVVRSTERG